MPGAEHLLPVIFKVCMCMFVCVSKIIFTQLQSGSGLYIADFYLKGKKKKELCLFRFLSCELNEFLYITSGPLLLNNRNLILGIRPFHMYPNQDYLNQTGQLAILK